MYAKEPAIEIGAPCRKLVSAEEFKETKINPPRIPPLRGNIDGILGYLFPVSVTVVVVVVFNVDHFKSLLICYSITSVLCFGFFSPKACGILVPQPGI